jgi:hypothetical protein
MTDQQRFYAWIAQSRPVLSATPEALESARTFLLDRWQERALELGRPRPNDLSGACKFASLFAFRIFGGELCGNELHQFVRLDGQIIDLTSGGPLVHDPAFFGNPDHIDSLLTCIDRVDRWVSEFLGDDFGVKDG